MIRIDDLDDVTVPLPNEVMAVMQGMADFEAEAHQRFGLHRMPGALTSWATPDGEAVTSEVMWVPPAENEVMVTILSILEKLHGIELDDMVKGAHIALSVVSEAVAARDHFEEMVILNASADGEIPTVGAWLRVGTAMCANGWQVQVVRPLDGGPRHAYLQPPDHPGDLCQVSRELRRLSDYLALRHPPAQEG